LWRSSYLELGVQLGWAIGDGRRDTNIERAADGTVREESLQEGRIDSGLRVSPVLAVGTRLY